MTNPQEEHPIDIGETPTEEDIDLADVDEQLDEDPETQKNFTDSEREGT